MREWIENLGIRMQNIVDGQKVLENSLAPILRSDPGGGDPEEEKQACMKSELVPIADNLRVICEIADDVIGRNRHILEKLEL